jgi:hypothetical protein
MILRFSPINNLDDIENALALIELFALASDEVLFSDLPLDLDTMYSDVLADLEKYHLQDQEDMFLEEPVAAKQLLEEIFSDRLFALLDDRNLRHGRNYAFERVPGARRSVQKKADADVSVAAIGAIWLSLFSAFTTERLLNISKDERTTVTHLYAKAFEPIAVFACSCIWPSVAWWSGRSWREADKVANCERITEIVGSGKVKPVAEWEDTERDANDVGIDGIVISTVSGKVSSASMCWLVGVTVQKAGRRKKRVDANTRNNLLAFFTNHPRIAISGAAVDPYPKKASLEIDYSRAQCIYIHRDELWKLFERFDEARANEGFRDLEKQLHAAVSVEFMEMFRDTTIEINGVERDLYKVA